MVCATASRTQQRDVALMTSEASTRPPGQQVASPRRVTRSLAGSLCDVHLRPVSPSAALRGCSSLALAMRALVRPRRRKRRSARMAWFVVLQDALTRGEQTLANGPKLTNTDGHRLRLITARVAVNDPAAVAARLAAHADFRTEDAGELSWWGRELTEIEREGALAQMRALADPDRGARRAAALAARAPGAAPGRFRGVGQLRGPAASAGRAASRARRRARARAPIGDRPGAGHAADPARDGAPFAGSRRSHAARTPHIACASSSQRPFVHVIHAPEATSHKRLFGSRRRGCPFRSRPVAHRSCRDRRSGACKLRRSASTERVADRVPATTSTWRPMTEMPGVGGGCRVNPRGWHEVVKNRQELLFGGDQISPRRRPIAAGWPYTASG